MVTYSPTLAGFDCSTFAAVSACATMPSPSPFEVQLYTPGAVGEIGTSTVLDFVPVTVTCTVAVGPVTEYGTTALIRFSDTRYIGAGVPLMVAWTPASVVW